MVNSTNIYYNNNKDPVWESIHLILKSLFYQKSTLRWTQKPYFLALNPHIKMLCQIPGHVTIFTILLPNLIKNVIEK